MLEGSARDYPTTGESALNVWIRQDAQGRQEGAIGRRKVWARKWEWGGFDQCDALAMQETHAHRRGLPWFIRRGPLSELQ
jgi:hypothetical protein